MENIGGIWIKNRLTTKPTGDNMGKWICILAMSVFACSLGITSAEARNAALLINTFDDDAINGELEKWSSDIGLKGYFSEVRVLSCQTENNLPTRENILINMEDLLLTGSPPPDFLLLVLLGEKQPQGPENMSGAFLSHDNMRVQFSDLFIFDGVASGRPTINVGLVEVGGPFYATGQINGFNIWRAEQNDEANFLALRNSFSKSEGAFSIGRFQDRFQIPMKRVGNSLSFNVSPENQGETPDKSKYICWDRHPETLESGVLVISSTDGFKSDIQPEFGKIDIDDLVVKDYYSPYFYAYSGRRFMVVSRKEIRDEINPVFSTTLDTFSAGNFQNRSVEYSMPSLCAFAFPIDAESRSVGVFLHPDYQTESSAKEFYRLEGGGAKIKAMAFGSYKQGNMEGDGLIYLQGKQLKFHCIYNCHGFLKQGKKLSGVQIVEHSEFNDIESAEIVWMRAQGDRFNALLFTPRKIFYWSSQKGSCEKLAEIGKDSVSAEYHWDRFSSGENYNEAFIWAGKAEGDDPLVHLLLFQNRNSVLHTFDLSKQIANLMQIRISAYRDSFPYIYLKDFTGNFEEVKGVLIHEISETQSVAKEIVVDVWKKEKEVRIEDKRKKDREFPFKPQRQYVRILDPKGRKNIVCLSEDMEKDFRKPVSMYRFQ